MFRKHFLYFARLFPIRAVGIPVDQNGTCRVADDPLGNTAFVRADKTGAAVGSDDDDDEFDLFLFGEGHNLAGRIAPEHLMLVRDGFVGRYNPMK